MRLLAPNALIISTHLDDAVISVGITIQKFSKTHAVFVATVFTEHVEGRLSMSAKIFNTSENGSAAECLVTRRAEDREALSCVNAIPIHLGFTDATFRRDLAGNALCENPEDILLASPDCERKLIRAVSRRLTQVIGMLRPQILLVPCALGQHIDHKIVRIAGDLANIRSQLGGQSRELAYYEDLPYACHADERGNPCLAQGYVPVVVTASDQQWMRKITAIRCYSSQLRFINIGTMPWLVSVEDYGRHIGGGRVAERLWRKHNRILP
jgi:LmbE family N-acetylglucosaminyl deacetylase